MSRTTDAAMVIDVPGRGPLAVRDLVLDFTGTLSLDGRLLPGVAERLRSLAERISITVMTADTFGTARQALAGLPVTVEPIATGLEKARLVQARGAASVVAIGNGANDVAMVEQAGLGIAVIGPEGAAGALVRAADIVTRDILDALDLLDHPLRVKATLRP